MTPFERRLHDLATDAREQRMAGDHAGDYNGEFPLVGYCFDNAYVCWHVLADAGIDATLVEGTTERVADDLIAEGIDPRDAEETTEFAGHVHYWIEATGPTGDVYTVDIASDSFKTLGECLVTEGHPDDYITASDSRSAGSNLLDDVRERGDRCTACGDHRYTIGGCPACEQFTEDDLA